jgi:hypothetical protein
MRLVLPAVVVASLFGQGPISTFAHLATVAGDANVIASVAAKPPTQADRHACRRVPRLIGLSLSAARDRSARAGCKLQVREAGNGQIVERRLYSLNSTRTVVRQAPRARRAGRTVTVWLKPLCAQSADPGPPAGEPFVKRGPTELVSGLYLDGGPLRRAPRCRPGTPSAGTIMVASPTTGAVIASDNVASGHLATIPLAPGDYTVTGTFAGAFRNGEPIETQPQQVTIAAGYTVRQDIVVNIP